MKDPDKIQAKLFPFVDLNDWKVNTQKCNELYKGRGYIFLEYDDVYREVDKLLSKGGYPKRYHKYKNKYAKLKMSK